MRIRTLIGLAALGALFVWSQTEVEKPRPGDPIGHARSIDGDSLTVAGREIRLRGIDAPEFNQTCRVNDRETACGKDAASALRNLVRAGPVVCMGEETDRYGRLLAKCSQAGKDMGAALVRSGMAVSYDDYPVEEAEARANRRGLWAGVFDMPRDWRAAHPAPRGGASAPPASPAPANVPVPPKRP